MAKFQVVASFAQASEAAIMGDHVFGQIDPRIVTASDFTSASDCRLILITDHSGQTVHLINHGRPNDAPSKIDFVGHGIMVMPKGDSAAQQINNARMILSQLQANYGGVVTPDFLRAEASTVNPDSMLIVEGGIIAKVAKEIYGPASAIVKEGQTVSGLQEQINRMVTTDILIGGAAHSIAPEITPNYAIGFRKPDVQKAFLLAIATMPNETKGLRIAGGDTAETSFITIEALFAHTLKGTEATAEHFKHIPAHSTMIVLVHANKSSRPVDPRVAIDEKFGATQFGQLPIIVVDHAGQVVDQRPSMFVVDRMIVNATAPKPAV